MCELEERQKFFMGKEKKNTDTKAEIKKLRIIKNLALEWTTAKTRQK